jgi:hypothetical protein
MFETVERKWPRREWLGIVLASDRTMPGWEIPLRLFNIVLSIVFLAIAYWAGVRIIKSNPPVWSPWSLFALAASLGIAIGLQVKLSIKRASRKRHSKPPESGRTHSRTVGGKLR